MKHIAGKEAFFDSDEYYCRFGNRGVVCCQWHTHDFYECVVLLKGKAEHEVNGGKYKMKQGALICLAPGEAHSYVPSNKDEAPLYLSLGISAAFFEKYVSIWGELLKSGFCFKNKQILKMQPEDFSGLQMLIERYKEAFANEKTFIFNQIFTLIVICVLKCREAGTNTNVSILEYAMHGMKKIENFSEGMSAFLRLTNMSQRHLSRLMQEHYKMTPYEYITDIRLNYAANLLIHSDLSVLDVSEVVGYESVNTFISQFKKHFGDTPKKYRDKFLRENS